MKHEREHLHWPSDDVRILTSLRKLIARIESGEITVESLDQTCILEEIEPKDGAKRFRNPGCYFAVITYRRNNPAPDLTGAACNQ